MFVPLRPPQELSLPSFASQLLPAYTPLWIHLTQRCIKSILSACWHTGLFESARQRLLKVSWLHFATSWQRTDTRVHLDRFVTTDQPTRREGMRPCPLTLRVPWLGSKTEKLVRRANDAVRLAFPAGEVRAVYRTNKAFNLPKDQIPTQSQSNLIYQFECRQCGSRYVGKTAQRFADRILKQKCPVRKLHKTYRNITKPRPEVGRLCWPRH